MRAKSAMKKKMMNGLLTVMPKPERKFFRIPEVFRRGDKLSAEVSLFCSDEAGLDFQR